MSVLNGQKPIGMIYSDINADLASRDFGLWNNFLTVLGGMLNSSNGCAKKSCSVYLWGAYDKLSINDDGGRYSWELSNITNSDPDKKTRTFDLDDWKKAYEELVPVTVHNTSCMPQQSK